MLHVMDNPKPKDIIGNFAEVTDSVFINLLIGDIILNKSTE